ncbi:hypothetical protein TL16_g12962 [Triparma laevis f. inornata]|uniref:EF-hand domain-containing protein n=2 Tax=Triparma laevis TaxID=1534972 RepID=A0A9W7FA67_9STRA|nr:hypothetical protein TL16_g12962 [Triparma laevis f. inornata]GMI06908.1 hypothetical protein TrLO_g13166 [Triparma laevis f. longispina]
MKLASLTETLPKSSVARREEIPFKQEMHDDPALPFIIAPPSLTSPTSPSPRTSLQSGLKKLTSIASKMDCTITDKMEKLKTLQITTLNKKKFSKLLKEIFRVKLTKWEISSLMDYFDEDKSGSLDFIEFKQLLFKLVDRGRKERKEKVKRDNDRARGRIERLAQQHFARHCVNKEIQVDYEYTEKDRVDALRKLGRMAKTFDLNAQGNSLKTFEGTLTPTLFSSALFTVFKIKVKPKQLGALMHHFDQDKGGTVDGVEFKLEFIKICHAAKKALKEANELQGEKVRMFYKEKEEQCVEKYAHVPSAKISFHFKDKHVSSALKKLGHTARFYDPERGQTTKGFQGLLSPTDFREQLYRVFGLKFTPKELGALVKHFDRDNNGSIDGSEFLVGFYTLSQKEKSEERKKVKREESERKLILERTVKEMRSRNKMKAPKRKYVKPPLEEVRAAHNLDRCKTAQALGLSDDITLGKLLSVSLAEAQERAKGVYGLPAGGGKRKNRLNKYRGGNKLNNKHVKLPSLGKPHKVIPPVPVVVVDPEPFPEPFPEPEPVIEPEPEPEPEPSPSPPPKPSPPKHVIMNMDSTNFSQRYLLNMSLEPPTTPPPQPFRPLTPTFTTEPDKLEDSYGDSDDDFESESPVKK